MGAATATEGLRVTKDSKAADTTSPGARMEGVTAVVTGATGGVGSAVARQLARSGASLVLLGRRKDKLELLRTEIQAESPRVLTARADFRRDPDLRAVSTRISEAVEGVDYLIHTAGVFVRSRLDRMEMDDFDELFETNVRARFALTRELLPLLRARRGHVVFINSSLGLSSGAEVGAYAGTMHAGRALADALRDEVNDDGVRVLTVYLGRTATPMQQRIHAQEGRPYEPDRLIQPETVAEAILGALSLPRDAEITDLTLRPMRKPPPPELEE